MNRFVEMRWFWLGLAGWLIIGMAGFPLRARAHETLRLEMVEVAQAIKERLQANNLPLAIKLGRITSKPESLAPGTPLINVFLGLELKRLGVEIKPDAAVVVTGLLDPLPDAEHLEAAELTFEMRKSPGTVLDESIRRALFGPPLLTDLFGLNGPINPQTNFHILAPKPSPWLNGNEVRPREGSPYSVEIRAASSKVDFMKYAIKPRKPRLQDETAFVDLQRGDCFIIRIRNDSEQEVATNISVDGINIFQFSAERRPDGQPRIVRVILGPKKTIDVKGWNVDLKRSELFEVGELTKANVPALASNPRELGSITVQFMACTTKDNIPLNVEEKKANPDVTSTGSDLEIETKYTEVKRQIGAIIETVSLRFNRAGSATRK